MKISDLLEQVIAFPGGHRIREYVDARNEVIATRTFWIPAIAALIKKYRIDTLAKAKANFLTVEEYRKAVQDKNPGKLITIDAEQVKNGPEWSQFRVIQRGKLIKKLRAKIGAGKTDFSDYQTNAIYLEFGIPLDQVLSRVGAVLGEVIVQTEIAAWFTQAIEGETFYVAVPTVEGCHSHHIRISPMREMTTEFITQHDAEQARACKSAQNFSAQLRRNKMKDVNAQSDKSRPQDFSDDWIVD